MAFQGIRAGDLDVIAPLSLSALELCMALRYHLLLTACEEASQWASCMALLHEMRPKRR